ncbi:MAG: DUF2470 domain-containing protein [Gammaproteobacteria bacterium]|nr:DUF2470 domain-containing protein [Gammaproteobacteria bacterium]
MNSHDFLPVRAFVRSQRFGVLATTSLAVPGYPFGSVTPYVIDAEGYLIILISTLAQHTRNLAADGRCSLTIIDAAAGDPQAGSRLTWLADARRLSGADAERAHSRYLRFFPDSGEYHQTHDFSYYGLVPVKHRYIGGFGDIHWIEADQLALLNPLAESEAGILEHMNSDHQAALSHYCQIFAEITPAEVQMVGVDPDGFDLLADEVLLRVPFEQPVTTLAEARQALVALAQGASA